MLCPSCGTNVGNEARLCKNCAGGSDGAARGSRPVAALEGSNTFNNFVSSSVFGVVVLLAFVLTAFASALNFMAPQITFIESLSAGSAVTSIIGLIMGRGLVNSSRIAVRSGGVPLILILVLLLSASGLVDRVVRRENLDRTLDKMKLEEGASQLDRAYEWLKSRERTVSQTIEKAKDLSRH